MDWERELNSLAAECPKNLSMATFSGFNLHDSLANIRIASSLTAFDALPWKYISQRMIYCR